MRHARSTFALTLLMGLVHVTQAVAAATTDPLHSPKCRQALDALQAQETAAAAASTATRSALTVARQRAASACLGGNGDAPAMAERSAEPPISVSPVTVIPRSASAATALRPASPIASPTPTPGAPAKSTPPTSITSCDAGGCWTNDGTRLNRSGAQLLGPRGFCTVQGTLLRCP